MVTNQKGSPIRYCTFRSASPCNLYQKALRLAGAGNLTSQDPPGFLLGYENLWAVYGIFS